MRLAGRRNKVTSRFVDLADLARSLGSLGYDLTADRARIDPRVLKQPDAIRHVRMGWNVVNRELGEFIEILPPQKRMGEHWYLGTADAVWQNMHAIERERPALTYIAYPNNPTGNLYDERIVERIVADIDDIVKKVRFPDWQRTNAGERLYQTRIDQADTDRDGVDDKSDPNPLVPDTPQFTQPTLRSALLAAQSVAHTLHGASGMYVVAVMLPPVPRASAAEGAGFRELLEAVTLSPAMGFYLDMAGSSRSIPEVWSTTRSMVRGATTVSTPAPAPAPGSGA